MRKFDYYEFAGIFVPGAVVVFGLSLVVTEVNAMLLNNQNQFSAISIMVIISYAAGYLVQAFGNILEKIWWGIRGGWPTDWIIDENNKKYAVHWRETISNHFSAQGVNPFASKRTWMGYTREIYAEVKGNSLHERIDLFNGSYALCKGIASSLLILIIMVLVIKGFLLGVLAALLVAFALSIYSMDKYARTYGRELYAQYVYLLNRQTK